VWRDGEARCWSGEVSADRGEVEEVDRRHRVGEGGLSEGREGRDRQMGEADGMFGSPTWQPSTTTAK
jgi:hypothetical protein